MKLDINNDLLRIKLNPLEMFPAFRSSLNVPLSHIARASTGKPGWEPGIRAPGIHIPFLLKAGTYHTGNGSEFWMMVIGKPYLVIDTFSWDYNRIVLTLSENKEWAERINKTAQTAGD